MVHVATKIYVMLIALLIVTLSTTISMGSDPVDCTEVEYDTDEGILLVSTLIELQCIGHEDTENGTMSDEYRLTENLDASETADWDEGYGFNSIGDPDDPFEGVFDGDGLEISGLTIDRQEEQYAGLFGVLGSSGKIRNVNLADADIVGESYSGVLVGSSEGLVSDVYTSGKLLSYMYPAGGVVGYNDGEVFNSSSSADIVSEYTTGGLVGWNNGDITYSFATGDVESKGEEAGGLVGYQGSNASISDTYATGKVYGGDQLGGLVGSNFGEVSTSYATGEVQSGDGIVQSGGLIGNNESGEISGSYWDVQTTSANEGVGTSGVETNIEGLETEQMQSDAAISNMVELDFEEIWNTSGEYPVLQWQDSEDPVSSEVIVDFPGDVDLQQNYPNPFNPVTTIKYELPEQTRVELNVYDSAGRLITTLLDSEMEAGQHTVQWDGSGVASGTYIYRLEAAGEIHTQTMTLIK